MKKIIVFMGSPGMNNIELARYLQITKYPQSIIIDRYDTWLRFPDEPYRSDIVEYAFYNDILKLVKSYDTIIVIAPFVLKEDRDNFHNFLQSKNIDFNLVGVWVERKYEDLKTLRRLRLPYRQVPDDVFEYLHQYRRSPTPEEPFDDLVYITREINTGMSKSQPYIADILTTLDRI